VIAELGVRQSWQTSEPTRARPFSTSSPQR